MKQREVKVGGIYWANVSGHRVQVQLDSEARMSPFSNRAPSYHATNLQTGRAIRTTARKLQGEVLWGRDGEVLMRK